MTMTYCIRVEVNVEVSNEQYLEFEQKHRELYVDQIASGDRSPVMSKEAMLQFWKETRSDPNREQVGNLLVIWDFSDVVSLDID